jgi:hypothetical protein
MRLAVLAAQVLFILLAISAAGTRRSKTAWTVPQLRWRLRLSIMGVVVGLVLPLLGPAQPGSRLAILCLALTLYSVFVLSKALYRKAYLKVTPGWH